MLLSPSRILARRSLAILIMVALFGVILPTAGAQAFVRNSIGCQFVNGVGVDRVTMRYVTTSSIYNASAQDAQYAWNVAQSKVSLVFVASSEMVRVGAYAYGNTGYDGITTYPSCTNGIYSGLVFSRWNTTATDGYDAYGRKQVMVHELGHALGLGHSGSQCSVPAIMSSSSGRYFTCGWHTPKADDINGVNAYYI